MEMNNHRPEEVTEMETEVIKNVKARNLKPGDWLHNTYGEAEVVLEVHYIDGCGLADTVAVHTTTAIRNGRSRLVCRSMFPPDHMVATIIEEG